MSDEPALQLRISRSHRVEDDDLIRFDETPDVQDGGEDGVFPDEDRRDQVGRCRVHATKVSGLLTSDECRPQSEQDEGQGARKGNRREGEQKVSSTSSALRIFFASLRGMKGRYARQDHAPHTS